MSAYTWEPIPEGETPNHGDVIRREEWPERAAVMFVGVDPRGDSGGYVVAHGDGISSRPSDCLWLRRVERPNRWERWIVAHTNGGPFGSASRRRRFPDKPSIRIWEDADGGLHIERVEADS